jgi:hypothetical protein
MASRLWGLPGMLCCERLERAPSRQANPVRLALLVFSNTGEYAVLVNISQPWLEVEKRSPRLRD